MNKLFLGMTLAASVLFGFGASGEVVKFQNTDTAAVLRAESPKYANDGDVLVEDETSVEGGDTTVSEPETPASEPETPVEDPVDEDPITPGVDESDKEHEEIATDDLLQLIEALKTELAAQSKDWGNIAKILISILGAVLTLALALLIKIIKLKVRNIANDETYNKTVQATNELFEKYREEIKEHLDALGDDVKKSLDEREQKRKEEAEANSIKLSESLKAAKEGLAINDVLSNE